MPSSRRTSRPSRARGWWIALAALALAGAGGGVAYRAVPGLVARRAERMLAAHGFPGARVRSASVGLDHLRLVGVTLGDGVAIGAVEIDAGVSLLWRTRIHEITLRGAELSARLVGELARRAGGPAGRQATVELPFEVVRIDRGAVVVGGLRAAVSGTISSRGGALSVDLHATGERVALAGKRAGIDLVDVRASLRSAGRAGAERLRACITGRAARAVLDALVEVCGMLPATIAELRALRAIDAVVRADAPAWQLRGRGTLGWAGAPGLTGGHVAVTAPVLRARALTLHGARISAELSASLAGGELRLEIAGTAEADRVELAARSATATSRAVRVPFAGRAEIAGGVVRVIPRRPIRATARDASIRVAETVVELASPQLAAYPADQPVVIGRALAAPRALRWSASAARLGTARFRAPSGALIAGRTLRWRAAEAEWAGARFRAPSGAIELDAARGHRAAWAQVTGPGLLELGAGEIGFHRARGRWTLDHGRADALGGELALEPIAGVAHPPIALIVHARGLELGRVLAAFARGHADGRGVLDGELAIRIDAAGPVIERGALRARAAGGLQLNDAAWRARASASAAGFALHQRIAATLSEFEYSQLAAVLYPAGADPELQITSRGRGKRVAQELDLVVNLRGVRDVAWRWPFAQVPRSKP